MTNKIVDTVTAIAAESLLYSASQLELIKERVQAYLAEKPCDDYELFTTRDSFALFRKRTLTEGAYEISHLAAKDSFALQTLLGELRKEVSFRNGKLIFCELPDTDDWREVLSQLEKAGYALKGQTPHLFAPQTGTCHYVLYLDSRLHKQPDLEKGVTENVKPTPAEGNADVVPTTHDHRDSILTITEATSVFNQEDRNIVEELIDLYLTQGAESGYNFFSCVYDNNVIAYCCFGLRPSTSGTYDLYWIATDSRYRKQGAGRMLMAAVESEIVRLRGYLVVLETTDTKPYLPTRKFYEGIGYHRVVHIPAFYSENAGLVVYAKYLEEK